MSRSAYHVLSAYLESYAQKFTTVYVPASSLSVSLDCRLPCPTVHLGSPCGTSAGVCSLPTDATRFERLTRNLEEDKFFGCPLDNLEYVGINKTVDPQLLQWFRAQRAAATNASSTTTTGDDGARSTPQESSIEDELYAQLKQHLPSYTGMPHPPPDCGKAGCSGKPWSAPFLATYEGPLHPLNTSGSLNLTQCNYYLPAGWEIASIHRCVDTWFSDGVM